ncbi:blue copper protein 1a-like [Tasmannia lanceolata]|uniref:blue copper protein 1a-like n=1 Tax=Tasmannia lanceolata TaxID=3420 RepID=UPI0040631ED7
MTVLPAVALATEFIAGDGQGWWTLGFDYEAWAKGLDFWVGEKLALKYPIGNYNIFKGRLAKKALAATGNEVITFATPGEKWYIYGIGQHFVKGQKLTINVQSALQAPASGAKMPSLANCIVTCGFQVVMVAIVEFTLMVMA